MKKRGFGQGKWNGFGGKVHGDETILQSAVRELREEAHIQVQESDLIAKGSIDFHFDHDTSWNQRVHIFFIANWTGTPKESEEMIPQWFSTDAIPYEKMWIDDTYWLPKALAGERIDATFVFSDSGSSIKEMEFH